MSKKLSTSKSKKKITTSKLKQVYSWLKESGLKHKHFFLYGVIIFMFLLLSAFSPLALKALADNALSQKMAYEAKIIAIDRSIQTKDYETWSSLIDNPELKSKINIDNFIQFTEAYDALRIGHVEEANIYRKQLHLKEDLLTASTKSQDIDSAIKNLNYKAWRALVGQNVSPQINAGNFSLFVKYYNLVTTGNIQEANKIKVKLGITKKLPNSFDSAHSTTKELEVKK